MATDDNDNVFQHNDPIPTRTEYTVLYNTGHRNYTKDIVAGDKHVCIWDKRTLNSDRLN